MENLLSTGCSCAQSVSNPYHPFPSQRSTERCLAKHTVSTAAPFVSLKLPHVSAELRSPLKFMV